MENLDKLTQEELAIIGAGLILANPKNPFFQVGALMYQVVAGSYLSGYDAAQNNCECQNN